MTVEAAHRALTTAEQRIREAEQARDEARDRLDAALEAAGWSRLIGAFTPDATPLYTNLLYPDAALRRDQVLAVLARQERTAA